MAEFHTTKYRHPEWKGSSREPIPLLQRHSLGVLVDNIINANMNNQYTGILFIGKSGSGKTTLTQSIVHRLHLKKNYVIKWFSKSDIRDFIKIISKLPQLPHILIFEDASYSLRGLSDSKIEEIAAELTYIRHKIKQPVIVILQIHYSKAIEKFFRDTDFTIFTSITDNERTNYQQLLGSHNSFKVNNFIRLYRNAILKGYFSIVTSSYNEKHYSYRTNDPFRPALVSSIGSCHHLLYPRESCGQCAVKSNYTMYKKLDPQMALDKLVEASTPSVTRSVINLFCFFNKGKKTLPSNIATLYKVINEMDSLYEINWNGVLELSNLQLKVPRKKGYRFKKRTTIIKKQLEEEAKKKNPFKDYLTET